MPSVQVQATFLAVFVLVIHTRTNYDLFHYLFSLNRAVLDVNDVAISQDGQMLASASDDKTVKVWKLDTGMEIRTIMGHLADVNAIAFSPNGEYIASGSDDKTVKVWKLDTGEAIHTFDGHSQVYAIAFSPDGKTLVSGGKDKTIKIWQLPE